MQHQRPQTWGGNDNPCSLSHRVRVTYQGVVEPQPAFFRPTNLRKSCEEESDAHPYRWCLAMRRFPWLKLFKSRGRKNKKWRSITTMSGFDHPYSSWERREVVLDFSHLTISCSHKNCGPHNRDWFFLQIDCTDVLVGVYLHFLYDFLFDLWTIHVSVLDICALEISVLVNCSEIEGL